MKKKLWFAAMIAAISMLTGCGRTAYVQKDASFDFKSIKTYEWVESVAAKESTEKKAKINDLTDRKIREGIDRNLQGHGLKETNDNPDVLLVYDVVVKRDKRNVSNPVYSQPFTRWYYNPYGRRWTTIYYPSQFVGYDNQVESVKEGTITLTITDEKTDKTIWQGWVTSNITGRRLNDNDIDASAKALVKKLFK